MLFQAMIFFFFSQIYKIVFSECFIWSSLTETKSDTEQEVSMKCMTGNSPL